MEHYSRMVKHTRIDTLIPLYTIQLLYSGPPLSLIYVIWIHEHLLTFILHMSPCHDEPELVIDHVEVSINLYLVVS